MLIFSVLTANLALSGCGGGGSGGTQDPGVTVHSVVTSDSSTLTPGTAENSYSLTEDTYGLQNATFMSAAESSGSIVLRAAIASSMTDPNFTDVFRIDITQAMINGPGTYSFGGTDTSAPQFPGDILFLNGHASNLLNTASGTITFTSFGTNSGDVVAGSFAVQVEDQNSSEVPLPVYSIMGNFNFVINTSGVLIPAPSPVPDAAIEEYSAKCASCHTLGSYNPDNLSGAPDLALKGGEIGGKFTAGAAGHEGIALSATEISDLKILLNAN
jgi:hypothetical protein